MSPTETNKKPSTVFLILSMAITGYCFLGALNGVTFIGFCGRNGCVSGAAEGLISWLLFVASLIPSIYILLFSAEKLVSYKKLIAIKNDVIAISVIAFGIPIWVVVLQTVR